MTPSQEGTSELRAGQDGQKAGRGKVQATEGVPLDWFGHFNAFCARCGVSDKVKKQLRLSLQGDPSFIDVNEKQQFLTAELGMRHLAKLGSR